MIALAESLADLQARYPKALEVVFDTEDMVYRDAVRPGKVPANLFCFEDGLTLCISRERLRGGGKIELHVSAVFANECKIADDYRRARRTISKAQWMDQFARSIPARFELLSGDSRPLKFVGWHRYVPHWVREEVLSMTERRKAFDRLPPDAA